jgi:hypothetical protein
VRIEESADHHVCLARAAMVRAPVQALEFLVWKHACDVVKGGPQRKAALVAFYIFIPAIWCVCLCALQLTFGLNCANMPLGLSR